MEKTVKKTFKIESRNNCTIHTEIRATRTCDDCDRPYCNDCIKEFWTHNFLSYAYLGEKKDFTKHWLCKNCSSKKRRRGLMIAIAILIGVFIIPIALLISNY